MDTEDLVEAVPPSNAEEESSDMAIEAQSKHPKQRPAANKTRNTRSKAGQGEKPVPLPRLCQRPAAHNQVVTMHCTCAGNMTCKTDFARICWLSSDHRALYRVRVTWAASILNVVSHVEYEATCRACQH